MEITVFSIKKGRQSVQKMLAINFAVFFCLVSFGYSSNIENNEPKYRISADLKFLKLLQRFEIDLKRDNEVIHANNEIIISLHRKLLPSCPSKSILF